MKLHRLKAMDECIRHLATAVSTASLYTVEHAQVKRMCTTARDCLGVAMADDTALSLMRVDDQLAVEGQPLPASQYGGRFARILKVHGVGHMRFYREVSSLELHQLVGSLARRDGDIRSSDHLRLGQVEVRHRSHNGDARNVNQHKASQVLDDVSNEELGRIMEVYEAVKQNRKLQVVGLSEIVTEFIDIFSSYADPLLALAPLRSMDEYTFTHSLNVCLLNLAQATTLGIEGPLLHDIGLAAMLHDIGKLFVPEEILNKPETLDERERSLVQEHPVKGAEYLVNTPGVPRMAVINAYEHHLRFDMGGYPRVSREWEQNLCSQMTSISDVYDSLRTRRPYRDPLEVDAVLINISQLMGTQLHPLLVDNFLRLMKKVHSEH